jgi:hypothetical protein
MYVKQLFITFHQLFCNTIGGRAHTHTECWNTLEKARPQKKNTILELIIQTSVGIVFADELTEFYFLVVFRKPPNVSEKLGKGNKTTVLRQSYLTL